MTPHDPPVLDLPGVVHGPPAAPLRPYDEDLCRRLLAHLGVSGGVGKPTPENLIALQHVFLDAVPYENLEIQLGRPTSIDPVESAERIVTGRGGYCYHLNGTFATLLASLGYAVTLVPSNPKLSGRPLEPEGWGRHVVILVDFAHETWIADVGLGDGFRDPIPLVEGRSDQPPFTYRLEHLSGLRWFFHHDPSATLDGFEMDVRPVPLSAFEEQHRIQSTSPSSGFVQTLTVQARRADHALVLRGCVLTRVDGNGKQATDVDSEHEWWDVVVGEFRLRLDDVDAEARAALWRRVRGAHEAWIRSGRR
ncbi:MAG TPA: arylamine N-acetyltransferase [Actinopolymorphaceae bacterium]